MSEDIFYLHNWLLVVEAKEASFHSKGGHEAQTVECHLERKHVFRTPPDEEGGQLEPQEEA